MTVPLKMNSLKTHGVRDRYVQNIIKNNLKIELYALRIQLT